jgi:tRNA threonylcarbamoyl adenosine modification protein (Sua5/YciO/YrdC/YwlC family)
VEQRASIVATGDRPPDPEIAARVRALLARGELCALPTETVYGLAARADDPGALERLRALKGRPSDLGFTWHVHERGAIERFPSLRPLARRLAERYWPGPLTLVLRGVPEGLDGVAREGWTGLRLPAHRACIEVLAACDFPVAMTSANRHGRPPATDAGDVVEQFGGELALVVDGGPSRLGEASGVLALGPGRFQLLREGLLRIEDLRRTAGLRIAFVCTGNPCRSPMAEALARQLLSERLQAGHDGGASLASFGFELASMGVHAAHGAPASPGALEVLGERGVDLASHRSRPATPELLARFDRVYALTEAHREALRAQLPPGRHPPLFLLDPEGADVPDPLGGPRVAYEQALVGIERALRRRLDEWA